MLFGSEGPLFLVPLATKAGQLQLQLGIWSVFGAKLGEKGEREKKTRGFPPHFLDCWAHFLGSSGQKNEVSIRVLVASAKP